MAAAVYYDYVDSNIPSVNMYKKVIKNDLDISKKFDVVIEDHSIPVYTVTSFEHLQLNGNLLKGVYEMGLKVPTELQSVVLPTSFINSTQDFIVQSDSNIEAITTFVLAILNRVEPDKNYPQVLCLSPTFEVAIQTGEIAAHMTKFDQEITLRYAIRGENIRRITEHIIIGTPFTTCKWLFRYNAFDANKITLLVVDVADCIVGANGLKDYYREIHDYFKGKCQFMFFSTMYHTTAMEHIKNITPNALIISSKSNTSLDNIEQYYTICNDQAEKYNALINIYQVVVGSGQMIIFCNSRSDAGALAGNMIEDDINAGIVIGAGDVSTEKRLEVLDEFRNGQQILIATDMYSMGIVMEKVKVVVNYSVPRIYLHDENRFYNTYLRRITKTGQIDKQGIVINLVSPEELKICRSIEKHFNWKFKILHTDDFDEMNKISG